MAIESAEMAQAMCCISANRPFSDLDHPGFKVFAEVCSAVGRIGDEIFVPSAAVAHSTAKRVIDMAQVTIQEKLKAAQDLVLSIDFWETRSNQNSAYVSARWVEGFKLYHCCLSLVKYKGAVNVDEVIASALKNWEIKDRISYLVSNMDLSEHEFFTDNGIEFIGFFDFDLQSVIASSVSPTFGATNLKGATTSYIYGRVVHKARRFVNNSTSNIRNVDIVCRWWSCLAMIESLVENRSSIDDSHGEHDDSHVTLTESEWETLELVKDALSPFSQAVDMLNGNKNSTGSLVPFLQFVIESEFTRTVIAEGDSKLGALAEMILKTFEARFGKGITLLAAADSNTFQGVHKRFLLAHALDPRLKQLKMLASHDERHNLWTLLLEEMVALDPSLSNKSKKRSSDVTGRTAATVTTRRGVARKENFCWSLYGLQYPKK